jgi:hypothetical protein
MPAEAILANLCNTVDFTEGFFMYDLLKEEVLAYAKQSYREQLFAGTSGNLSVRDWASGYVVITPGSVAYETMTIDDIMVIDLDGNTVEGKNRPSSEWRLHAAIYREKPDIGAVVHTHSPYATSFAILRERIPFVLLVRVLFYLHRINKLTWNHRVVKHRLSTFTKFRHILSGLLPSGRVIRLREDVKVARRSMLLLWLANVTPLVLLSASLEASILLNLPIVGRVLTIASNRVAGIKILND